MTRGEIRATGKVYESALETAVARGIITAQQADDQRMDNISAMSPESGDDHEVEEPAQTIEERIAELRGTAELWNKRAREALKEAEEAAKNAADILEIITQLQAEKDEQAAADQLKADFNA